MRGLVRRGNDASLSRTQASGLTPWDPWSELNRIRSEMDNIFGGFFGQGLQPSNGFGAFSPNVDLYENNEEYVLSAHLPGMKSEDIQMEVSGNTIHIFGESKPNIPEQDVTVHVSHSSYGKFDLRYTLPLEINAQEVKASYQNGVLDAHLPKAEAAKPKSVQVKVQS